MLCEEARNVIAEAVATGSPKAIHDAVHQHLEGCPGCRAFLDEMITKAVELAKFGSPEEVSDEDLRRLKEAVMARLGKARFNLVRDPWIPVLTTNGQFRRVGILDALTQAGRIRQIAASNPMDNVAILRFLLAVLLWYKRDAKHALAQVGKESIGIPASWLTGLEKDKAAFELLGDGQRFYQDASLKNGKLRPIADLLCEFPGEDSINHMRHVVHDGSYGFCPACCVMGILRLSVWAPANKWYPSSVNPPSAAYAIVKCKTLLETLAANLPEAPVDDAQAPWLSDSKPRQPGPVTGLAWRPRKLWLNVSRDVGSCANCGSYGVLVKTVVNEGGWPTPKTEMKTKKFWDADPHLLKDDEPISLPTLEKDVAMHCSKFWRDAFRLKCGRVGKVLAVGPVVNQFTFQDATSVDLPNPSAQALVEHSGKCRAKLCDLLKWVTPNRNRQHPEIRSMAVLLTPHAEARVRTLAAAGAIEDEKKFLRDIYEPVVRQVIASTTTGSPLRRRAANNYAQALLNKKIGELVDELAPSANAATPAKPPSRPKQRRPKRRRR